MDCPICHAENAAQAVTCSSCGRSLNSRRRPNARRRNADLSDAAAVDSPNPAAWRAYRVALWSMVPGLGLLLGPFAIVLGCLAVRGAGEDVSARNRANASVLFGALVTLTQWVGTGLIFWSWHK